MTYEPSPDLSSADFIRDPFATLAQLRESDPVHWHSGLKSWCVTRYDDVARTFRDARFSADRVQSFARSRSKPNPDIELLGDCVGLWMVFNDPPNHTRLRKLTSRVFTKWSLDDIARPLIEARVDRLIAQIEPESEFDFVTDFAWPLPAGVIADLLGVPEEHLPDLKSWSNDLATFVLDSRIDRDKYAVAARGLANMNALFEEIVEQSRRRGPFAGDGTIVDRLVAAHDADEALSKDELIAFCVLLLFAGHETTAHFLANGLRALIENPEQWNILAQGSDDAALLGNAVNEMLRFDGPILAISRTVKEDHDFDGRRFRRGERVYAFNAAANRDPRAFADADRFDVRRDGAARMLGFGHGIHLCLGIHLARLEGQIAFAKLLNHVRQAELIDDLGDWTNTLVMRGPKHMRIRVRS